MSVDPEEAVRLTTYVERMRVTARVALRRERLAWKAQEAAEAVRARRDAARLRRAETEARLRKADAVVDLGKGSLDPESLRGFGVHEAAMRQAEGEDRLIVGPEVRP